MDVNGHVWTSRVKSLRPLPLLEDDRPSLHEQPRYDLNEIVAPRPDLARLEPEVALDAVKEGRRRFPLSKASPQSWRVFPVASPFQFVFPSRPHRLRPRSDVGVCRLPVVGVLRRRRRAERAEQRLRERVEELLRAPLLCWRRGSQCCPGHMDCCC